MDEKEKEKLKKDIDILFGDDEDAAIAIFIEYLPVKKSIEELTEEDYINLCAEIMSKIESDDELYEYFTSKKETNIDMYITFLPYTKKHIEDIHKAIEERTKLDLKNYEIVELIKSLGPIEIEKYLIPEKVREFDLNSDNIKELIKATGKIEKYLTPEKVREFGFDSDDITELIKATGNIEAYLFKWQKDDKDLNLNMANLIYKKCCDENISVEEYLTLEKVREFKLYSEKDITNLIKATGNIGAYLFKWESKDEKYLYLNKANLIYKKCLDEEISVEEYLTLEKVKEFGLNSFHITELIKATGNIDAYLTLEKVKEFGLNSDHITELIKATGNIEEYLTPEIVRDLKLNLDEITDLIKATGNIEAYLFKWQSKDEKYLYLNKANLIYKKCLDEEISVEEYLTPEKVKELNLYCYETTDLIKATEKIEEYLTPEIVRDLKLNLDEITELIKATGKIDEYLTPEIVRDFGLSSKHITSLIKATGKIEEYLTPEKVRDFGFSSEHITELIKATGNIEAYSFKWQKGDKDLNLNMANLIYKKCSNEEISVEEYLTPEKVRDLKLNSNEITGLIKATENIDAYLLPGQNKDDEFFLSNVYYKNNKEKFTQEIREILDKLHQKNSSLYSTINFDILFNTEIMNICNDEQLIRITHYPEVQEYILRNNNKLMTKSLEYLMKHDENWIISFDKIIKQEDKFKDLMANLQNIDSEEITEDFIQNFLSIISDSDNYFNIQNYEDVNNYSKQKEKICLDILKGNFENIPEQLQSYSKNDLYKFALLEYKFGISLEEADRLVERYGTDSDKLPKNTISEYIRVIKSIIQDDNIKEVINFAIEKGLLGEPWLEFPNARNAEGKILNMFADLYNKKLYSLKTEDKLDTQELYIDKDGKKYQIDVYEIKNDFDLNVRVEGAYSSFIEPNDFNQYYESPNIENHGNCESYIGNDLICTVPGFYCICVGYNYIHNNTLMSSAPYDFASTNKAFSSYDERSDFRTPEEMKNHTRYTHNEMVKERLFIDKDGNVVKNKPNYVIWIEEDTKTEREMSGWKEQREKDEKWIMTKKAAAQLGVPIVVIDREHFAERETEKIDLMKKLITGEQIDKEKYKEYLEQYGSLSKAELIEQLIIKFENNRIGLQFNKKLNQKYFTQEQLEEIIQEISVAIEEMSFDQKKECLFSLKNVSKKEYSEIDYRLHGYNSLKNKKKRLEEYYIQLSNQTTKKIENLPDDKTSIYDRIGIQNCEENKKIQPRVKRKSSIYENLGEQVSLQTIIDKSEDIIELFDKAKNVQSQNKSESPVHGVQHIRNVLLLANYIGKQNELNESDLKILREAAIYHDICHQQAGHKEHAKEGAEFYLQNVESDFDLEKKEEIAFLIEAHEIDGAENIEKLINNKFTNITEERKKELLLLAQILQDADRLDMLRYDIEKPDWQRFNPNRLNNPKNTSLISAVIELNTRQAIENRDLEKDDFDINHYLKLYLEKGTTYNDTSEAEKALKSELKKERSDEIEKNI